jgi:mannose-1-phosphate guanylyltransferase
MPASDRLVCAIMAGGSGTRFWPMSRRDRPKQLLALLQPESLLAATVDRIAELCPAQRTLVITAARLADATAADLPQLPPQNIIAEPVPRNTAPCMALAAIAAQQLDPDAIVALLPADHHIANGPRFCAALATAARHADAGHLVTLGIVATRPETGFGYIERGSPVEDAFEVVRFVEKPDLATAAGYLAGGKHLWNGGIFVVRADAALATVKQHLPAVHAALAPLLGGSAGAFGSEAFDAVLAERFAQSPSISIDYGIAENSASMRTVALDAGWSDVGTWASLISEGHGDGSNFTRGDVLNIDTEGSVLVGEGVMVAAIGLRNVAIVATKDAVLAMPLNRSQDVRQVVAALAEKGREELR